jgi:hypothetical protein
MLPKTFNEWVYVGPPLIPNAPAQYPDGSRTEPSGRGYFPGELNGQGYEALCRLRTLSSRHEPKAATAKVKPTSEWARCHIASAKKDEVSTPFYPLLDT